MTPRQLQEDVVEGRPPQLHIAQADLGLFKAVEERASGWPPH